MINIAHQIAEHTVHAFVHDQLHKNHEWREGQELLSRHSFQNSQDIRGEGFVLKRGSANSLMGMRPGHTKEAGPAQWLPNIFQEALAKIIVLGVIFLLIYLFN